MLKRDKIISQTLICLVGAVVAVMAVALIALVPLRAQQNAGAVSTTCEDDACTCQDNMNRLGIALLEYEQDYDDKYPPGSQGPQAAGFGWFGPISEYGIKRAYYTCPEDATAATKPLYALSYGFNANLPGTFQTALVAPDLTVESFELSGTAIYASQYDEGASHGATVFSGAGDGTDGNLLAGLNATRAPNVDYATGYLGKRTPLSSGSQFPSANGRHYNGANYAFADGHVHFFLPSDVSSGTNAATSTDAQTGTTTGNAAGTMNNSFKVTFSGI